MVPRVLRCLLGLVFTALTATAGLRAGVGYATAVSPEAAGAEAARGASQALGDVTPRAVIVFAARTQTTPELVAGIGTVLPTDLLYGCEGYAPVTQHGNAADQGHTAAHAVAVLALGGDIRVTPAAADTAGEDGYRRCGRELGRGLKPHLDAGKGRLVLTFGDQHVGAQNRDVLSGLQEILGRDLPIVGAAAGGPEAKVIVRGSLRTRTNVAILVNGDFHVRTGMGGGQGDLVQKAAQSFAAAMPPASAQPGLIFVFDCGGRRGQLHAQNRLTAEWETMVAAAAGTPFFGFYGGGEIGCRRTGSPAEAVGFHIATAAVVPGPAPEPEPRADTASPFRNWTAPAHGEWTLTGPHTMGQFAMTPDCRLLAPPSEWTDYTFRFRARKTGGNEGFLAIFRAADTGSFYWWNIGGWRNTRHAIEKSVGGRRQVVAQTAGEVTTGRWYDVRIDIRGDRIRCFLDNEPVHDFTDPETPLTAGSVGVGTWATTAEFTDITVTDARTENVLLAVPAQPAADTDGDAELQPLAFADWSPVSGTWSFADGTWRQTTLETNCRLLAPAVPSDDYVFEIEARKTGGEEGFMVIFRAQDENAFYWWNVAGWRNTQHGLERKGGPGNAVLDRVQGTLEPDRWYTLRVAVNGDHARCWLDGELIQEARDAAFKRGGIGLATWRTQAEFRNPRFAPIGAAPPPEPGAFFRHRGGFAESVCATVDALREGAGLLQRGPWHVSAPMPSETVSDAAGLSWSDGACSVVPDARVAGRPFWSPLEEGQALIPAGPDRAGAASLVYCRVDCARRLDARLNIAANTDVRVWLNGYQAARVEGGRTRAAAPPWHTQPLRFRRGPNTVLLRVDAADGQLPHVTADVAVEVPGIVSPLRRRFPRETAILERELGNPGQLAAWIHCPDGRVRETACRLAEALPPEHPVRQDAEALRQNTTRHDTAAWLEMYLGAHRAFVTRSAERCGPIALLRRPTYGMRGTNATMFARRTDRGSEVLVADPRYPDRAPRVIFTTSEGFIMDLHPDFDGTRLLMTCKTAVDQPFHIWELKTDGSGLRQITDGPWHDINPVCLPDGRIAFCSSRVEAYSMCQNFLACALHTCAADGTDIRRIDYTTLCTNAPAMLADGSLVATRWEYQDKTLFSWQSLWSIRPDGRNLKLYYGNTITVPNSLYGPRPIPGDPHRVLMTMAPHHYPPIGDIAVVDRRYGVENPDGMRQITFATQYRVTKGRHFKDLNWGPGDRFYPFAYTDPNPVAEDLFMVAYGGSADGPKRFRLCFVAENGAQATFMEDPAQSLFCPVRLAPRPRPASVASGLAPDEPMGTFRVMDLYRGLLDQGVPRGTVRELRVLEVLPKPYNTEGPRYRDHYPVIGHGSYYVKRILGSVPVEPAGNVCFDAPANRELYVIAVDAAGKEIQRMGSVTQILPGEQLSCIGCHENRLSAPPVDLPVQYHMPPRQLQPPAWMNGRAETVDFVRHVQPILDRYCVRCHSGPAPKAGIDLSDDKTRMFNMAYTNLTLRNLVEYYYINPGPTGVFPALQTGSAVSRLTQLIETEHSDVRMDEESRRAIYAWIDANAPYYGTWEMSRPHIQGGRDTWTGPRGKPLPWFQTVLDVLQDKGLGYTGIQRYGHGGAGHIDQVKINLTHPEWSALLLDNLAQSAGGRAPNPGAAFPTRQDQDFQRLLKAIEDGSRQLYERPRMDMPEAVPIAQTRDFGRVF